MQLHMRENIWQFVLAEGNIILFAIKFTIENFICIAYVLFTGNAETYILFIKYETTHVLYNKCNWKTICICWKGIFLSVYCAEIILAGGVSDYILSKVSSIDHQLSSLGWQITSAHTDQGHLKDTVHNEWTVQSQRWLSKSAHSFTSPEDIWQCTIWASNLSTTFSLYRISLYQLQRV